MLLPPIDSTTLIHFYLVEHLKYIFNLLFLQTQITLIDS